jgi:hypothetical protein
VVATAGKRVEEFKHRAKEGTSGDPKSNKNNIEKSVNKENENKKEYNQEYKRMKIKKK